MFLRRTAKKQERCLPGESALSNEFVGSARGSGVNLFA